MQLKVLRLSYYQRNYSQINLLSLTKWWEVVKHHLFEALEERQLMERGL